jgi:hypothetical protein
MRKLILILLAFLAIFTYIRAFEEAQASETLDEIPVEITR